VRINFARAEGRRRDVFIKRTPAKLDSVMGCFDLMSASSVRRRVVR
jgi:hypothetical protein